MDMITLLSIAYIVGVFVTFYIVIDERYGVLQMEPITAILWPLAMLYLPFRILENIKTRKKWYSLG